jgi:hypothetical protein
MNAAKSMEISIYILKELSRCNYYHRMASLTDPLFDIPGTDEEDVCFSIGRIQKRLGIKIPGNSWDNVMIVGDAISHIKKYYDMQNGSKDERR